MNQYNWVIGMKVIESNHWNKSIDEITAMTKTQIKLKNSHSKYRIDTGWVVGGSGLSIRPATDDDIKSVKAGCLRYELKQLAEKLYIKSKCQDVEKLQSLVNQINELLETK